MNCKQVEELMPLFVEGDLQADVEMSVAAHLHHCQPCAHLSAEFEKSQTWLRSYTPPEFDNTFFADVKQNVLQQIKTEPPRALFFERFFKQLRERWALSPAYAFAALLLLAGALTLFFYIQLGDKPAKQEATDRQPKQEEVAPPQIEEKQEERPIVEKPQIAIRKPKRNHRLLVSKKRKAVEEPLPENQTGSGFDLVSQGRETIDGNLSEFSQGEAGLSKGMLRIEFQTSDPNIRIIWFAPKPATDSRKIDTE